MKKPILYNILLSSALLVLSTWIYAYTVEKGDSNAVGMYVLLAFIPWIIMIGANAVALLFANHFKERKAVFYAWLMLVPLAMVFISFLPMIPEEGLFRIFAVVFFVVNARTAFMAGKVKPEQQA